MNCRTCHEYDTGLVYNVKIHPKYTAGMTNSIYLELTAS